MYQQIRAQTYIQMFKNSFFTDTTENLINILLSHKISWNYIRSHKRQKKPIK